MKKKLLSLTTALLVSAAFAVPVFAASPDTSAVMTTPVSVPKAVTQAKGYTLTAEEEAAVATTPEQAVALAAGVTAEASGLGAGVIVGSVPTAPAIVSLAKTDILKNATVQRNLANRGVTGAIVKSAMLVASDGRSRTSNVNLSVDGLVAGEKVAIMYYVPGDVTPRFVNASWVNGKLRARLPLPCLYNIVK